jgi:hypothetical protein
MRHDPVQSLLVVHRRRAPCFPASDLDLIDPFPDPSAMRWLISLTMFILVGCAPNLPVSSQIPVGGVRETVTRANLDAARERTVGGLIEPGWLPAGFTLAQAEYLEAGDEVESVDLTYEGAAHYLHIWQTSSDDLAKDPLAQDRPAGDAEWSQEPLAQAQIGRADVVEFSARLEDGRTITVDSDLDPESIHQVLRSLLVK